MTSPNNYHPRDIVIYSTRTNKTRCNACFGSLDSMAGERDAEKTMSIETISLQRETLRRMSWTEASLQSRDLSHCICECIFIQPCVHTYTLKHVLLFRAQMSVSSYKLLMKQVALKFLLQT